MKYSFGELREHFAIKRGYRAYTDMSTAERRQADRMINQIIDAAWYYKQWGFSGDRFQVTFEPSIAGSCATSTVGQRVVNLTTAVNESYNGIKVQGQLLMLGNKPYRILRWVSSTKLIIEAPLASALTSADTFVLYFLYYPMPYDCGVIRSVVRANEDIGFINEYLTPIDNSEGTPDYAYNAGRLEEDFLNSGTLTLTDNSANAVYTGTVSVVHIGMSMLIKENNNYQWFKVIDVETTGGAGTNYFILDRKYQGTGGASISFALNPKGLLLIGFKDFPVIRDVVDVKYTFTHPKMTDDADETLFPDDSPLIVGIESVAVKWEATGEANINEVLYQDKKFKEALRAYNFRGQSLQMRMHSLQELSKFRRFPRMTNPWNTPPFWG
jgi:hypothetical protein